MLTRSGMLLALCLAWCGVLRAEEDAAGWKAGAASVVITPGQSMWMAGYAARTAPSERTEQDLFAKALALESGDGTRLAIVTTDLIGIPRSLRESLEVTLRQRCGLAPEAILLNSSHTHCGPELRPGKATIAGLGSERVAQAHEYTEELQSKIVSIVETALERLEPARLTYNHARAGFSMNRRLPTATSPVNRPYPDGPVDQAVPVLRVHGTDGALRAVLFGYACHNTTLSFNAFCGDYAGYAQEYLEEAHPGTTALFMMGCGGDQNPYPRRQLEHAQQHGRALANAVEAALEAEARPVRGSLKLALDQVVLDFADPPSREELERRKAESKNTREREHAARMLEELDSSGTLRTEYPYLVQVVRFGDDLLMVALSGEVVVDYSLRLKQELDAPIVWMAGYSNDLFGYVPSRRVLEEGGYEAGDAMLYSSFPGPFAPSIEERIIGKVHELAASTARK